MGKFFSGFESPVKLALMAVLFVVCVWLVWRNILSPAQPSAANQGSAIATGPVSGRQGRAPRGSEPLSDIDPTLRPDLLQAAREVEYNGSARNIFQAYTPPPPPPPPTPAPATEDIETPLTPPVPVIPLKFYGTAQPPGRLPRKAFLTNGEEILIAQDGDIVAKSYKVIRIGPTSIELEDIRSQERHQLPLIEE